MPLADAVGFAASTAVLATFCTSTMIRLRVFAVAGNMLFILYGFMGDLYPVLLLHLILLPINAGWLWKLVTLQRRARPAGARSGLPARVLCWVAALIFAAACCPLGVSSAQAGSCSTRVQACRGACQPDLVRSGAQAGGTVEGCHQSCSDRLAACLRSGVWVHMGRDNPGLREAVDRH